MSYLARREVGPLVLEIKTNSFYRVIFHATEIRIPDTQAKILWTLAEHPNQLMPIVDLYNAMYRSRPIKKRPFDDGVLRVYASQLRKTLQRLSGHDDACSHIICDYRGGIGLYSEPQRKVKQPKGPKPGIRREIEAARVA